MYPVYPPYRHLSESYKWWLRNYEEEVFSLYMEEITDGEERQLALDNWMRLRDKLLIRNLMTNKSNATWNH